MHTKMAWRSLANAKKTAELLKESLKCLCSIRSSYNTWTHSGVVKSPYKRVQIPNCTMYDYIWQNLDKWPERTLSKCAETGRGYTYEQTFLLSNTFAANLRKKLVIRDGDAVAVMMPNDPDYPIVVMGIHEAGGVVTTINPVYTAYEVHRQLLMTDPKAIVVASEIVNTVKEAIKLAKMNIPIIEVRHNRNTSSAGTILFDELSEDVHVDKSCLKGVRTNPDDTAFILCSSGTTGMPKGVELSNRSIVVNCEQINEPLIRTHKDTTEYHQDSVMTVLPMYHCYALTVILLHKMSLGIKMVTIPQFKPESFLTALENHKSNVLFVAPPLVLMMASHPACTAKTLEHLEIIINGAAPMSATDAERFFEKAKRKIDFRQGYGLTETSPVVALSEKGTEEYGSVGCPIPNTDLKIIDFEGRPLGPNETGEILVRGPQVMKGYRNNPEANAQVFTKDGWMRTGDLGVIDDRGVVTIVDRMKELIKVKGYQVPPAELEAVLRQHPNIADVGVVGISHNTHGETPKAFVVLKKGEQATAAEIAEYMKHKLAPYKRVDPEHVTFLEAIPRSPAGKILRKVLKEKYC